MNAESANNIPLEGILLQLGHTPVRRRNREVWYRSPFRQEKEPSFHIDTEKNTWYDFGLGKGGKVVDFGLIYYKTGSVAEALQRLSALTPVAPSPKPAAPATPPAVDMTYLGAVRSRALIQYLKERGISRETWKPYVQEMNYRVGTDAYYALAFGNKSGGYELRNKYFKGTHKAKAISALTFMDRPDDGPVAVFEGFFDFLTAAERELLPEHLRAVVVLNSAAMKEQAEAWITTHTAGRVDLYLDHDDTGKNLARYFMEGELGKARPVIDRSGLYAGYNDLNDWHRALVARSLP